MSEKNLLATENTEYTEYTERIGGMTGIGISLNMDEGLKQ